MAQRPNIVLITSHDLGQHLGCYGVDTVQSPHIDRLAEQGVRFSRSYCTQTQCSPSRSSIYTGRYPHANGVMGLTHAMFQWDLHEDEQHLAGVLREAGYTTALAGLQHETRRPEDMGFDRIYDRTEPWARQAVDHACSYIAEHAGTDQPFYLQIGFFEPHRVGGAWYGPMPPDTERGVTIPPFIVDDELAREDFAHFQGAIKSLDEQLGRLFAELETQGIADDTLVIFTVDHGIPHPRAKTSPYDAGMEVALIIRWANGGIVGGQVYDEMVSNVDYFPTLMNLLGLPTHEKVQGRSFAPLLRGEAYEPRTEVHCEMTYHGYADPQRVIRTEQFKLILNFLPQPAFYDPSQHWERPCRPAGFDNPRNAKHPLIELYDLIADPLELKNLADDPEHDATRRDLLDRLHGWMVSTNDPLLDGLPLPRMFGQAIDTLIGNTP